jgi:hypothetical protein
MNVIDCNNHIIRKALRLSGNEMFVLNEIYILSNNIKYGGWCVKSKAKIAETLDLSERTVFQVIEKLHLFGLIEKNEHGHVCPSDFIRELSMERENIAVAISANGYSLATTKIITDIEKTLSEKSQAFKNECLKTQVKGIEDQKNNYAENAYPMQNLHTEYAENAEGGMQKMQTSNNILSNKKKKDILSENYSDDAFSFARWFDDKYFIENQKNVKKNHVAWAKEYDALIKAGYNKNEIWKAIDWAKADDFWSANFFSPLKLREKNKQGVRFIDVFIAGYKKEQEKKAKIAPPIPPQNPNNKW